MKYKYLRSKYQSSFYFFNDQLDYGLASLAELEITKENLNIF